MIDYESLKNTLMKSKGLMEELAIDVELYEEEEV